MRAYEELFIVKPDTPEEELDHYIEQITGIIEKGGGKVERTDKWGVRKLAYRVSKFAEGNYTLVVFNAPAELVREVERRMRVTDMVIKFITVRIDEKLKKIEKRKKKRDKRAARKPPPPVAPPSMPTEPAHAAPGAPTQPAAPVQHAAPGAPAPAAPAEEAKAE